MCEAKVMTTLLKFVLGGCYVELYHLSRAFIWLGRCWRSIYGPESVIRGRRSVMGSLIHHPMHWWDNNLDTVEQTMGISGRIMDKLLRDGNYLIWSIALVKVLAFRPLVPDLKRFFTHYLKTCPLQIRKIIRRYVDISAIKSLPPTIKQVSNHRVLKCWGATRRSHRLE